MQQLIDEITKTWSFFQKSFLALPTETEQTLINYSFNAIDLFLDSDSFNNCILVCLVNVQTIDFNNDLSILDVK